MDRNKNCHFCGEEILEVAIKCKHCQSMLATVDDDESKRMAYFRNPHEKRLKIIYLKIATSGSHLNYSPE
jgi:hypothetical protein